MKIYLVGGAVRDKLLNQPFTERDWLVVGATPEEMLAQGFKQVGKDFPVFLHPKTKEEYALARVEQKTGPGYHGFGFRFDASVTIEEDLLRRDITINAMAEDESGQLIDVYGGQQDLQAKLIRHVSPAFVEDPVRLLRIARFMARFTHLGFSVADETIALMSEMVTNGEVDALAPERVWKECERALAERTPVAFFEVLRQTGALKVLMPEVDALWGVPNPAKYHPEIDTGIHTMMVLEQSAMISPDPEVRFAALVHDLGKALTPKEHWPGHPGHGENGVAPIKALSSRLKVPKAYQQLGILASRHHIDCHRALYLAADEIIALFDKTDAWRKEARFLALLDACEADMKGRTGFEDADYPQKAYLTNALAAVKAVTLTADERNGLQGIEIKNALADKRKAAILQFIGTQNRQGA